MHYEIAQTKNVLRFLTALNNLKDRPMGVEGMGLLYGRPGEGKSTVVAHAVNANGGIYLRANACWTVTSMLGTLLTELRREPKRTKAPMITTTVQVLAESPRPIFVDEADYLFRQREMLDTLRDIYDLTGCPVVLIGMEDIARAVAEHGRFARRITQWVEFAGIDMDDARTLADTVCEVGVADDLLEHLYREAKANVGLMVVGLSRIETLGRTNHLPHVDRKAWGKRELFYGQPTFTRTGANGKGAA